MAETFRGVKVYIAQQYGAAGVLIYSDPGDDGYVKGDMYPRGPYRPEQEYSAAACSSCRCIGRSGDAGCGGDAGLARRCAHYGSGEDEPAVDSVEPNFVS